MHAIALLTAAALSAATPNFYWHGVVAAGDTVEIRGITGDIRAVPSDSAEVEVFAVVAAGDPTSVRVREHAGGLTVCAMRDTATGCPAADDALSALGARVDYVVKIPRSVHFSGRTVDGRIEADSLHSNVAAETVNGPVYISTTGKAKAHTVNGSIQANLLKPFWVKQADLSTVNGAITLRIPTGVTAVVKAETRNGKVVADAPFRGSATEQTLDGRIGRGGAATNPLLLRSVNGSIEIKQDY